MGLAMRETDTIPPMWEHDGARGGRALALLAGAASAISRRLAPHLSAFARGQQPAVVLAWGAREYRLGRKGVLRRRRDGRGWEGAPHGNLGGSVARAQALDAARAEAEAARLERDAARQELGLARDELERARDDLAARPAAHAGEPLDLSPEALRAAVRSRMGIDPEAVAAEGVPRDADSLKGRLGEMRLLLQSLDDVTDFDLVEAVDEDLYQLHKAVEYKLKNHRASEAKARLDKLFRQG